MTSSRPPEPPNLSQLPQIPRDGNEPVFAEPWEAQAFAMTLTLHEAGLFTWHEWADALSDEIATARRGGDPGLGDTYYHHWLAALEGIVQTKGVIDATTLAARKEAWEEAAAHTPHGKPITL